MRDLAPAVRANVDYLIGLLAPYYPRSTNAISAAVWADDLKAQVRRRAPRRPRSDARASRAAAQGVYQYSSWHYKDLPVYRPANYTPPHPVEPGTHNVVWAIETSAATLADAMLGDVAHWRFATETRNLTALG